MSCTSSWEYEKKVGAGWSYNEPDLAYDAPIFDKSDVYYNALSLQTVWDTDTAPAIALYEYETGVGQGWEYDQDGLAYDSSLFDDANVYFNGLGLETSWITDSAPVISHYDYETKNGGGYEYNQPDMAYNAMHLEDLQVFYNYAGRSTEWFLDDTIENCTPDVFIFMDGETYQFQDGTTKYFN